MYHQNIIYTVEVPNQFVSYKDLYSTEIPHKIWKMLQQLLSAFLSFHSICSDFDRSLAHIGLIFLIAVSYVCNWLL